MPPSRGSCIWIATASSSTGALTANIGRPAASTRSGSASSPIGSSTRSSGFGPSPIRCAGRPRHGLVPGYYAQEHEGVRDGVTVLDHMKEASDADDLALRTLLGMFGLHGEVAFQDAGTLSGGEKTKLALAILVAGRKNLLLLDEPTNNLDPPSRTAIAEALQGWPGAMLLVSHDQEFVEALAPARILLMPDGDLHHGSDEDLDIVALAWAERTPHRRQRRQADGDEERRVRAAAAGTAGAT